MTTYIFLTRTICGIGGAEQYTYNKVNYLTEKGYRVFVFSGQQGTILIDRFLDFQDDILAELAYVPHTFSRKRVEKLLDRIVKTVSDDSPDPQYIIQTDSVIRALWGELLARRLNGRHLAIILQEQHNYSSDMIEFLKFKLSRKELAGITRESVSQMIRDPSIPYSREMRISASCSNVVGDCEDPYSRQLKNDAVTIASIGRLDKPYLIPMLQTICEYCKGHPEQDYNVLLIGGTDDKKRKRDIENAVADCKNISLLVTGFLYPIPRSLIQRADLFISTAGSSHVSYQQGRPTIRIDPVHGKLVGVIGYDFQDGEKSMYETIEGESVASRIDMVLEHKISISYKPELLEQFYNRAAAEFERQLSFVSFTKETAYYDQEKLLTIDVLLSFQHRVVHKTIGKLFGGKALNTCVGYLRKIK